MGEVLGSSDARGLGAFAGKWISDPRPELRVMLLEYVSRGLMTPHHQPLAKRLFKLAESKKDDELMGRFLVALDRSTQQRLRNRTTFDFTSREYVTTQILEADPSVPRGSAPTRKTPPVDGRCPPLPRFKYHLPTFTLKTRRYLQRRAWRYFRTIGKSEPARYAQVMSQVLAGYADQHFTKPVDLLGAWGLSNALYRVSSVIEPGRSGFDVAPGRSLAELQPAPAFLEAWKLAPAPLFVLLGSAGARVVRRFAIAMLEAHHAGTVPETRVIRGWLDSPHEEVQTFAAKLLERAPGLERWTLSEWLELLRIESPNVVHALARLFQKHVAPERIDPPTALALALSPLAPIGEIGLGSLKSRPINSADDIRFLLPLAEAGAESVRRDGVSWLISKLDDSPYVTPYHARLLLDSSHRDVRDRACSWVFSSESLRGQTLLWSAMAETPYDDVRAALLVGLERVRPALPASSVRAVWASVILAVHRGSRAKPRAARQVAERIAAHPEEADQLLPLLSILLRSLRSPERASGLAAIATAAFSNPDLLPAIARHLPGVELVEA